ncbi:MAG: S8 family serine peptidase [Flavobacteriales bacterium]
MKKQTPKKKAAAKPPKAEKLPKYVAPPLTTATIGYNQVLVHATQVVVSLNAPMPAKAPQLPDLKAKEKDNKKESLKRQPWQADKKLKADLCKKLNARDKQLKITDHSKGTYKVHIDIPEGYTVEEFCKYLRTLPEVRHASPRTLSFASLSPNDPYYTTPIDFPDGLGGVLFNDFAQWGYYAIGMDQLWDTTQGNAANTLIGIVDTGISLTSNVPGTGVLDHPDLSDVARFKLGTNFLEPGTLPRDDHSHGTHVAGTIGCTTNNGQYMAGTNWHSHMLITRALGGPRGEGFSDNISEAVRQITDQAMLQGRRAIINLSLGGPRADFDDPIVMEDYQYALDNGTLIIAASGNDSHNNDPLPLQEPLSFPAMLAGIMPNVVAVGAVDHDLLLADFSNTGPETSLVAPGVLIASTNPMYPCTNIAPDENGVDQTTTTQAEIGFKSGTSMATPHVSGLAAIIWGEHPHLNAAQVANVLKYTATALGTPSPDGHNNQYGHGLINAPLALAQADRLLNTTGNMHFDAVAAGDNLTLAIPADIATFHATTVLVRLTTTAAPSRFTLEEGTQVSPGVWEKLVSIPESDSFAPRPIPAEVTYSPVVHAETEDATLTIIAQQGLALPADIDITGTAAAAPPVYAYTLVLDKSGSMAAQSGVPGLDRLDMLKRCTETLIDVLNEGTRLSVVAFNQNAVQVVSPMPPLGPPQADPLRQQAKVLIGNIQHEGGTSIGDGLILARNHQNAMPADRKNIIVFTDGMENDPVLIANALPQIPPTTKIFAIGMGTPQGLDIAKLEAMTNTTGGSLYLTGLDAANFEQWVTKIFITAVAEATGEALILDPAGRLAYRQKKTMTFFISDLEREFDVILLGQYKDAFRFTLVSPSGKRFSQAGVNLNSSFMFRGQRSSYFRMRLRAADSAEFGQWRVIITVNEATAPQPVLNRQIRLNYTLIVKAKTAVVPSSVNPVGSGDPQVPILMNASVSGTTGVQNQALEIITTTESDGRVQGSRRDFVNKHTIRKANIQMTFTKPGVHNVRQVITGKTKRGYTFTRELLRTIYINNPKNKLQREVGGSRKP